MREEFRMTPLGKVLTERREMPSADAIAEGRIPIVAKIGFNDGQIQLRSGSETKTGMILIHPGDLVVSGINAAKGAIAVYDEGNTHPIAATIHYGAYLPNKDCVDVNYLWLLLRSRAFRESLAKYVPGGIKTELKAKRLLPVPVPLPKLPIQSAIVQKVSALNIKIEQARELRKESLNRADELFDSKVDALVDELSQKFETYELNDVVDQDRGISYGVVLTGAPVINGIPTLRAGDLQKFRVLLHNVKQIDPAIEAKYKRTRLSGNELLLRIRGGLGELAVCPKEMIGGNVSREIAVIPLIEKVLPEYGMYVLAAPRNQARMAAHSRGIAYQGINLKDVRKLPIPIPPRPIQEQVVRYLNQFQLKTNSLRNIQSASSTELDALLPSILDMAFKGHL